MWGWIWGSLLTSPPQACLSSSTKMNACVHGRLLQIRLLKSLKMGTAVFVVSLGLCLQVTQVSHKVCACHSVTLSLFGCAASSWNQIYMHRTIGGNTSSETVAWVNIWLLLISFHSRYAGDLHPLICTLLGSRYLPAEQRVRPVIAI